MGAGRKVGTHSAIEKYGCKMDRSPQKQPAKDRILLAIPVIGMIVGLAILAWPIVTDWLTTYQTDQIVQSITSTSSGELTAEQEESYEQAVLYNENLAGQLTEEQPLPYEQQLATDDTGAMAWIEIPKISVKLPIYHGTSDVDLASGVGHIQGTSLPVGGPSTHTVLSAHSGMQTARMFDDIRQLVPGDLFAIHVLGKEIVYEVTGSEVVLPDDTSSFEIQQGQDLCTLVTCTPYGINDHRLLVHAKRTDRTLDEDAGAGPAQYVNRRTSPFLIAFALVLAALIGTLIARKMRKKKKAGSTAKAEQVAVVPAKRGKTAKRNSIIHSFLMRKIGWGQAAAMLAVAAGVAIAASGAYLIWKDAHAERGYQAISQSDAPKASAENQTSDDSTAGIDWDALKEENPDIAAWIQLPDTVIDYPVMQAADENPHYYLRHNLWHEWSIGGNPYIDHRCTADGQNIIVYGHHMGSIGTMFTPLYDCYRQTEFDAVLANNNLYWSTPDSGTTELHAVCAMRVDDEYATVQKFSFEDQNDFQSWIRQMVSESSAQYSDWEARTSKATRAIALVTCSSLWSGSSARTVVLFAGN